MKSLDDLKERVETLEFPDELEIDPTTEEGNSHYRDAWTAFGQKADNLVRDIVRANALSVFGKHSKLADKVLKHFEAWRIHADETIQLWERIREMNAGVGDRDILDVFYDWIGVEGRKSQRLANEKRLIAKEINRQEKINSKLFREWQLLIVELEAHTENQE